MGQQLDSDFLDQVWCKWVARKYPKRKYFAKRYKHIARNGIDGQSFETWLWKQGASVKQENNERFIVFFDESNMLMFILKFM
jgi:hypothetical protein